MTRQDFDKWLLEQNYFTYYPTNDAIKLAVEKSTTNLYNLLSKEIGEKDYWKQRCEAAEYLLAPDASTELPKEYQKWKKLKDEKR